MSAWWRATSMSPLRSTRSCSGPPIDRVEWRGEHAANVARLMGRPPGLELDAVFFRIPHTNAIFELVHFRGIDQARVTAGNADIGATHFGFAVDDIEATVARLGLEVQRHAHAAADRAVPRWPERLPQGPRRRQHPAHAARGPTRAGCRSFDRATHRPERRRRCRGRAMSGPRPTAPARGPGAERAPGTGRAPDPGAPGRIWLHEPGRAGARPDPSVARGRRDRRPLERTRRGSRRRAGSPGRRPTCAAPRISPGRSGPRDRMSWSWQRQHDSSMSCRCWPRSHLPARRSSAPLRTSRSSARATPRKPPRSSSSQPSIASRSSRPGPIPALCWTCGPSPCPAWPGTWSGCGHGASSTSASSGRASGPRSASTSPRRRSRRASRTDRSSATLDSRRACASWPRAWAASSSAWRSISEPILAEVRAHPARWGRRRRRVGPPAPTSARPAGSTVSRGWRCR